MGRQSSKAIAKTKLVLLENKEVRLKFEAESLWNEQPVVFYLLRRPGCILCRYQARELWDHLEPQLQSLGIRLVCVIHEYLQAEVRLFSPKYWPGEIYHDEDRELFKFLGGGKVRRACPLSAFNPFHSFWKEVSLAKTKVKEYNYVGEKFILGGVLIVNSKANGGEVLLTQVEKEIGRPPSLPDILSVLSQLPCAK
ncbi:hypothetical protein CEUSTIGMA_g3575.t1 [Chlamydomonas eustigma]|uniref:Peroxiredoxin-like 2A n=1 Tax=Chlamydomonas eustigma TaxID=1157962 RepID=A0A250WZT8_9CHLO|nr:hypothetical protein CEUSTIGMA_g3575.t1 [Chlamydomonas eustigma]|eukprot:GAX76132.1 hypothetical protein CEUSTIGMA_g3575.t1 [Chlamydomonas eustigma]